MLEADVKYINEGFEASYIPPEQLDELLASGWRHFGTHFYRYNIAIYEFDIRDVIPLRIRLDTFSPSKTQRRVLRANANVDIDISPIAITSETTELFERHKQRFKFGIPDSIYDFLSDDPAHVPCRSMQITIRVDDRLAAVSYFDIGATSVSAIYAMFDPDLPRRSLGIFTMLKEIEFACVNGKTFYYQGYAYEGPSFYDYKKRFHGTEGFNWNGGWSTLNPAI